MNGIIGVIRMVHSVRGGGGLHHFVLNETMLEEPIESPYIGISSSLGIKKGNWA